MEGQNKFGEKVEKKTLEKRKYKCGKDDVRTNARRYKSRKNEIVCEGWKKKLSGKDQSKMFEKCPMHSLM